MANPLATPSQVLIRFEALRQTALTHPGADDWLLWLALLRQGDGVFVPRSLAFWRQHPEAFHNDIAAMRASSKAVVEEWFPRLGFSQRDVRRYFGRLAIDAIVQRNSWGEFFNGLLLGLKDPWAAAAAAWFRWEHKRHGVF